MSAVDAERRTGILTDIPEATYHADPGSLSHSGAKDILSSPGLYRWRQDHPTPPSEAMEVGTCVHALVLEGRTAYEIVEGGRGVTERKTDARARGVIPVTAEVAARIEDMATEVDANTDAAEVLRLGAQREASVYAEDPDTGVLLRCRIDALGDHLAADLKTGRPGVLNDFGRQAVNFGYDMQAAWYGTVLALADHPVTAFLFVIVESEAPYFVGVRELDTDLVLRGRRRMRRAIDTYAACRESGNWPGPAPFAVVSAPAWALREES